MSAQMQRPERLFANAEQRKTYETALRVEARPPIASGISTAYPTVTPLNSCGSSRRRPAWRGMATQEFYIRNETDTEARGPFNFEQLSSLVDSGQITPVTLFYDATAEKWVPVNSNIDLNDLLFPEKKKLNFRTKQPADGINKEARGSAPITVGDMLAAAEGRTSDTKNYKDPTEAMARAANLGRWSVIVTLLLAAAGEVLPLADTLMTMDPLKIVAEPLIILGALDLFLAVVLALGVVGIYPFVRFRAALGLGFLGFIFWTQGQTLPLIALGGASLGLYCSTVVVSLAPALFFGLLAIGGFALVGWHLLS
jgi:hypothetical protein